MPAETEARVAPMAGQAVRVVNVSVDKGLFSSVARPPRRKRMVMGSVPIGGSVGKCLKRRGSGKGDGRCLGRWASNLKVI